MKIAIPTKGSMIDNHFGHCEYFTIIDLNEKKKIIATEKLETAKVCGCKSNLAEDLSQKGVTILLAGGIGGGAIEKLKMQNIEVIAGFKGSIENVIEDWQGNNYKSNFSICTEHDGCSN